MHTEYYTIDWLQQGHRSNRRIPRVAIFVLVSALIQLLAEQSLCQTNHWISDWKGGNAQCQSCPNQPAIAPYQCATGTPIYLDAQGCATPCDGATTCCPSNQQPVYCVPYAYGSSTSPTAASEWYQPPVVTAFPSYPASTASACAPPVVPWTGAPTPCEMGWVEAEYLLWWTDGDSVPVLVSTSSTGTPLASAGILGQPNTNVLFGGSDLFDQTRSGFRVGGGLWIPDATNWGIEANYLMLADESADFAATSTGDPILARPFFNVLIGAEDAQLVAFPAIVTGNIAVHATSKFQAAELLVRERLSERQDGQPGAAGVVLRRVDLVAGYRFAELDENLGISESLETAGPTQLDVTDSFDTKNQFHGGVVGFISSQQLDRWSLDLILKLGLGNTRSQVQLDGQTATTVGGVTTTENGGLLVLSTNRGSYTQNNFAVLPELGAKLGYLVTSNVKLTVSWLGDQVESEGLIL